MREMNSKVWKTVFDNDNTCLVPEIWAQEALMILEANMVAASLVYRDFENEVASYGDTVKAHRPGTFTAKRKTDADDVTVQDASTSDVDVKLNQHLHVSFIIKDGEESMSFKDLVALHLQPALIANAQALDEVVLCQVYEFMAHSVGKLGTDPTKSTIIAANEMMNTQKCPVAGRNMILSPNAEGSLLDIGEFTKVNEAGDAGSALRTANLGQKFNWNFFMCQNTPSVSGATANADGLVNNVAGYAAGSTSIAMNGITATFTPLPGMWCTIAGDMTPQQVQTCTGGSTPTNITILPGLKSAVLNDAVITFYTTNAVNLSAGYAAGYAKDLVTSGGIVPKTGQLMSFGITAPRYGLLSTPTATAMLPNRPLDLGVANSDVVGYGPDGEYCFGFHRNAVALVTRPLAQPKAGTGALSYVANYNGLSVRVTITYDGYKQGHLVTVDLLAGVKTLDTNLGCVMYA